MKDEKVDCKLVDGGVMLYKIISYMQAERDV